MVRIPSTHLHAVIVGGSLAGLTSALALTRDGVSVSVLERASSTGRSGAALTVDPAELERALGEEAARIVLSSLFAPDMRISVSQSITWADLRAGLVAAIDADPHAKILHDQQVIEVGQGAESAWALTDGGDRHDGDVLIGADGHRSLVRRSVAPEKPDATFAGYSLWVGVAHESDIGTVNHWPEGLDIQSSGAHFLLGYPLPSEDGTLTAGRRRLGWAWYDSSRNSLLHSTGAVLGGVVQHSIRSRDVPEPVYDALHAQAGAIWPEPWRQAIRDSLERRAVTATPITEYVPDRLASGRLALVGNAAHVPTPMTGNGFAASLDDAEALADVLRDSDRDSAPAALGEYESKRLRSAQSLVEGGQGFSKAFAGR